jgi:hypothetical protein
MEAQHALSSDEQRATRDRGREADVCLIIQRPPLSRPRRRLLRMARSRQTQTAPPHQLKTGEPFAMAGIYAREPTEFDTAAAG